MTRIALLGPQAHAPTAGAILRDWGVSGRVATITAGWQERESEDDDLVEQLRSLEPVPLRLYERADEVWRADPELRAAHNAMQTDLRALRDLHLRQLEPAGQTWVGLLESDAEERLLGPERDAALAAIQRLDEHVLDRIQRIRDEFETRWRPFERPSIAKHRLAIADEMRDVSAVVIEGGHIAVLLNRMRLFGIADVLENKMVAGCAGGAMALCSRVVLFNDSPAIGRGHAEVALPGLGLARGVVALSDATERLRVGDPDRMRRLALRLAPDVCASLDPGATLVWDGKRWTGSHARAVGVDGSLRDWGRAA